MRRAYRWLAVRLLQRRIQHILHQRGLPEPETPVRHTTAAVKCTSSCLRLCSAANKAMCCVLVLVPVRPAPAQRWPAAAAAATAGQPRACGRLGMRHDSAGCRNRRCGRRARRRGTSQYAVASSMICGSCSTTSKVLPASRSRFMTVSRAACHARANRSRAHRVRTVC